LLSVPSAHWNSGAELAALGLCAAHESAQARTHNPYFEVPMSLSMYDVSVPVLVRGLGVMSEYLEKAAAHAREHQFPPANLLNARLAPDMMSLAGQVQRASDNAKGGIARLANVEAPSFPDNEVTLEDLKARIARTISFLESVDPKKLEGSESRPVELKLRSFSGTLSGQRYLLQVLLPNFFFHVTTAHDILRHNGLQIGKADYFGRLE
jgi:hypothetical protein